MAALSEEFGFELEALRATYGEDEVAMLPGAACAGGSGAVQVALAVAPRTDGGAEHEQYVAGRLVLTVGAAYPEEAPGVQLAQAKGELLPVTGQLCSSQQPA
jgi:hypothetical protein